MLQFHLMSSSNKQIILKQGETAKNLYFIIQGECRLLSYDPQDIKFTRHKEHYTIGQGCSFGEQSILYGQPEPFTVKVSGETFEAVYIKNKDVPRLPNTVIKGLKRIVELRNQNRNHIEQ